MLCTELTRSLCKRSGSHTRTTTKLKLGLARQNLECILVSFLLLQFIIGRVKLDVHQCTITRLYMPTHDVPKFMSQVKGEPSRAIPAGGKHNNRAFAYESREPIN